MKKAGLVGGMGPESTVVYYQKIVDGVRRKIGQELCPPLIIESIDVFKVLDLCKRGNFKELTNYLSDAVDTLVNGGADFAVLTANTPHIVFNEVEQKSSIPLISIVDTCLMEAKKKKINKIGLMGTIFTMKEDFFKTPFLNHGMDIVIPKKDEMDFIDEKISKELELGILNIKTKKRMLQIIDRMYSEDEIEAVILGCTELPLILNSQITSVPCLDTSEIHVEALVSEIIE
ncbi:aspartate/glutamate racemase family protein [Enterococcus sp. DIV0187]|uniref:aspartate/glutamate racemase family protein n=1 Tax=Enterococcus sp. DIV0187 TaxID=2774644 RepID=UPI003F245F06